MKQKTITTDKATLLVVELLEGLTLVPHRKHAHYWFDVGMLNESYQTIRGLRWVSIVDLEDNKLHGGSWKLLGRLPDITEEKASKVVVKSIHTGLYAHYVNGIPVNTYCYKESSDSLYSLLQANEVYFENPVKFFNNKEIEANGSLLDWHEAQSKVWDKERTYILTKVD